MLTDRIHLVKDPKVSYFLREIYSCNIRDGAGDRVHGNIGESPQNEYSFTRYNDHRQISSIINAYKFDVDVTISDEFNAPNCIFFEDKENYTARNHDIIRDDEKISSYTIFDAFSGTGGDFIPFLSEFKYVGGCEIDQDNCDILIDNIRALPKYFKEVEEEYPALGSKPKVSRKYHISMGDMKVYTELNQYDVLYVDPPWNTFTTSLPEIKISSKIIFYKVPPYAIPTFIGDRWILDKFDLLVDTSKVDCTVKIPVYVDRLRCAFVYSNDLSPTINQ